MRTSTATKKRLDPGEPTPQGALDEGGLHELLGYQLAQAAIVTTRAFVRSVGDPLDLRPVEFTLLQLISENAPTTATQLAKALAITTPGITIWIDRLEKRGLVVRERSDTDRRATHLQITGEGRAMVSAALGNLLQADREVQRALSEGERQMLLELLQKVARSRAP